MGFISRKVTFKCGSINKASSLNSIAGLVCFFSNAINCGPIRSGVFLETSINNNSVISGSFSGSAVNSGSLTTGVFAATSSNFGCACVATFTGSSVNKGSVTGATFAATSANSGFLITGTFSETSLNLGSVCSAIFTGSSINRGSVTGATFGGSSVNSGSLNAGTFIGTSLNFGSVSSGTFTGSSVNRGTVDEAIFAGTTVNGGTVTNATFSETAQNTGSITGFVTFLGSAINSGSVQNAVFSGSTCNLGTIISSGSFFGSSSNSGVVSGNVVFSGNSVNVGTVCGDAIFAENSSNNGGIILGCATTASGDPYFYNNIMLLNGDGSNCQTNAEFLDSSTGNYVITNSGNVTQGSFSPFTPNKWGLYFNGSSSTIVGPEFTGSGISGICGLGVGKTTIETWIYPTCLLGTCSSLTNLAGNYQSAFCDGRYYIRLCANAGLTGAGLVFGYTDSAGTEAPVIATSNSVICLNTWQHIAIAIDATTPASSKIDLYVNGTKCCFTGKNLTTHSFTYDTLRIGGGIPYGNGFNGYMSNFRVTKGQDVYTGNFTPSTGLLTTSSQNITGSNVKLLTFQDSRLVDASCTPKTISVNAGTPIFQPFSPFQATELYTAYKHGGSAYFGGSNQLTIPANSNFAFGTGNFTVEFWVYPTAMTAQHTVLRIGNSTDIWVMLQSNTVRVDFTPTTLQLRLQSAALTLLNNWTHVAIVREGTGTNQTKLFVNGVLRASGTLPFNFTSTGTNYVGGNVTSDFFVGYVSNLRVTKGSALYSGSTLTIPTQSYATTANTSLLLKFANGKIVDRSSVAILQTVGDVRISTTQVKYGSGSLFFDGTGDYLSVPTNNLFNFGIQDFTIEFWIYPLAYGGTTVGAQIFGTTNGATSGYSINLGQDINSFRVISNASGSWAADATVSTGNGPALNTWTHMAIVRQGANLRIYKNGISVASSSAMLNKSYSGTTAIIGRYSDGTNTRDFNGYIDDLRISKGIARYTSNFTPPDAGFLSIN